MKFHAADSMDSRRQQLLHYSIVGMLAGALVITVGDVIRLFLAPWSGWAIDITFDLFVALVLAALWRLNHAGYTRWAGLILFGFVALAAPLIFPGQELDQILVVYAVPVVLASFILIPAASFGVAGLCAASYSAFYLAQWIGTAGYNAVSIVGLFFLAYLAWLISTRLEKALQEARQAALEHERRLKVEQEQRLFAETMQEVGAALAASLDLEDVLQCLMEQVSRILPNDMVNIMQVENGHVRITHGRGYDRFAPPGFLKSVYWSIAATPTLRRMMETGEVVIVGETDTSPDWIDYPETNWARSYAGVPIRIGKDITGFLNLNSLQPGFFLPEHAGRLQAFGTMAAVALQNARLYEAARQSAAEAHARAEEIRYLNETLEQRVDERTAQLSAANEELKRLNRMRDEFLANVSHELRTPLTGILGLAEALEMKVYGVLDEQQHQVIQAIQGNGQRLLRLINDLLDLSKIDVGKLKLEVGPVVVAEVCQASLHLIREGAQKKNLQMSTALDPKVTMIEADERRLKQMLVNLLSNAVKFTAEGGRVGLEVTGDVERGMARFIIWDTGIGISPQDAAKLFQPFVQVDGSFSRPYEGAGLGLMLVRRMAEMHGGNVTMESEGVPGKGSRFTLSLPWAPATPAEQSSVSVRLPNPGLQAAGNAPALNAAERALILLVDDSETNLTILADFLRSQAYRVEVAHNGTEALAQARTSRPDLVVMDIQTPEMGGLDAIRQIRAEPNLAGLPIIAVTALAVAGDRERCLEAGANDYMSKPIRLGDLAAKAARWLARQS